MSIENEQIYIIDEVIQFEPDARRITNLTNNKIFILHSTCARCLHLLLEHCGVIVSYKKLLTHAWPESHDGVSHNTFYQSVRNLRQALAQIDYHKQAIITIRGKGLRVCPSINIEKRDSSLIQESTFVLLPVGDYSYSNHIINLVAGDEFPDQVIGKQIRKKRTMMLGGIMSVILMTFVVLFTNANKSFFHSYLLGHVTPDGCSIFLNKSNQNTKVYEYFTKNEAGHICGKNEFMYLTTYKNTTIVSAFVCNKKLNSVSISYCVSHNYLDMGIGN